MLILTERIAPSFVVGSLTGSFRVISCVGVVYAFEPQAERDQFLAGRPLVDTPRLFEFAAKVRFIPLTERNIETEHAVVNQQVSCTRHGPVLVSLARRLPMLERMLVTKPAMFSQLVECFTRARVTQDQWKIKAPSICEFYKRPQSSTLCCIVLSLVGSTSVGGLIFLW